MQRVETNQYQYWDFIEDGNFDWREATLREQFYFREVAAAFLRATFTIPEGYVIDVLEAEYNGSRFPIIALGWNHDPEPLSLNDRQELIWRMVEPLNRFVNAVNWQEVGQIREDSADALGVEGLRSLLANCLNTVPLAQRCWDALSDTKTKIHLAPRPLNAASLLAVHAKRAARDEATDKEWGRTVERSTNKLQALSRMAESGTPICCHSLEKGEEHFFLWTDAAIQNLVLIEITHDDRNKAKTKASNMRRSLLENAPKSK